MLNEKPIFVDTLYKVVKVKLSNLIIKLGNIIWEIGKIINKIGNNELSRYSRKKHLF